MATTSVTIRTSNDPWSGKETRPTHLEPDSGLVIDLDGSGIVSGETETEQGFTEEVCGLEEAATDPEVTGVELVVLVPGATGVSDDEEVGMDAEVSGVVGIFRDPSGER